MKIGTFRPVIGTVGTEAQNRDCPDFIGTLTSYVIGLITLSKRVMGTIASCPKIKATISLSLINTQLSVDQVDIPCERTQKNELFYPINSYFKDHSEFRRFFKVIVSQMNRGNAKF